MTRLGRIALPVALAVYVLWLAPALLDGIFAAGQRDGCEFAVEGIGDVDFSCRGIGGGASEPGATVLWFGNLVAAFLVYYGLAVRGGR